jgi:hypothetical protein
MPKYPNFKYELSIDNGDGVYILFLSIGESAITRIGVEIKVKKIEKQGLLNVLWVTIDGGKWTAMYNGCHVAGGKHVEDFKRWAVDYPSAYPNGRKIKEHYL